MDFKGKYKVPATPDEVWAALHNSDVLSASVPGCESVEQTAPGQYKAIATFRIGPVKARFQGKVTLEDAAAPPGVTRAMKLSGEGQGGPAGFARGQSEVHLTADGAGTVLEYSAKAVIGGKLAQIGQRLIDGAAKSIADEFFARFSALMQSKAAEASPAPSTTQAQPQVRSPAEGLAPQVWVAGLIGIIVILLIFFSIVL